MPAAAKRKPEPVVYITRNEVLMGRDKEAPLNAELEANLERLLAALNRFRAEYGRPMIVTSGYRPATANASAGGAKLSAHLVCLACDFKDDDGALDRFCLANLPLLESCGLYLEDPVATPKWCHLQIRPTKSRVFKP